MLQQYTLFCIFSLMDSTHFLSRMERRSYNEDCHSVCTRTEEEKQRRRKEWLRQQELEKQHEKLKQQKILEFERKRAQALKLAEQYSICHSQRDSKSPPSHLQHRERSTSNAFKSSTFYEKLNGSLSEVVPLFKGPQGIQINTRGLRQIKVNIRRNVPATETASELQRDIVNPEDVILKRREGEGCKPIFDREEIKTVTVGANVEEQRTVASVDLEQSLSTSKLRTSRKRSLSLSPIRKRSYGHGSASRYRRNSSERGRDYKEKYTERSANKYNNKRSRSRSRLRSRERDQCTSSSRSFMGDRTYRDSSRRGSSESSRERRDRDGNRSRSRSREPRNVTPHNVRPMPFYYDSFLPRPILVNPMVPCGPRKQVPPMGRGRHPGLMTVRLLPPGFIPPDMYKFGPLPYVNNIYTNSCSYTNRL